MIAQAEPVDTWGLEPWGNVKFPTQSRWLGGTAVARRTRRAAGAAYSRSNVAEQYLCSYGRRQRRRQRILTHEQKRSSSAAAPPVQLGSAFQADRRNWPGSNTCCAFLVLVIRPEMSGDLENSRDEYEYDQIQTSNDK
jgi:hypothetical protein